MTGMDLVCLTADKSMSAAVEELLDRHQALGIRPLAYEVVTHPQRDSGCFHRSGAFLQDYRATAARALVVLDFEWTGAPQAAESADRLESMLEERLRRDGIDEWARAVVIDPELEAWVFSSSPHVADVLGWNGRSPSLRDALAERGHWPQGEPKPRRPKEAMDWALRNARPAAPRSSAHFRELAQKVSIASCTDRAIVRMRSLLQEWFPLAG